MPQLRAVEERRAGVAPITEGDVQATLVGYLELLEGQDRLAFHHSPNEGRRGGWARGQFKRLGSRAGEPDLTIYLPGGRLLLIELKTARGTLSPAQIRRHRQLALLGWPVLVIRFVDADDALAQLVAVLEAAGLDRLPRVRG